MIKRPRPILALAASIILLLSWQVSATAQGLFRPVTATTITVQVGPNNSISFVPATQTINVGDTVNWVWSSTSIPHSTTSGSCPGGNCTPNGIWNSNIHTAPFNFSFTFNTPGSFPYFCAVHLSAQQGTIIVQPIQVPTNTPPPTQAPTNTRPPTSVPTNTRPPTQVALASGIATQTPIAAPSPTQAAQQLPRSGSGQDLLVLAGGVVLVLIVFAARRARSAGAM